MHRTYRLFKMTTVECKKPKFRRQRIVKSGTNAVDESLFGEPARLKQMTGNRTWSCSGTAETGAQRSSVVGVTVGKRGRVSNDPEVVQIITKDLIRNIKVPGTPDPSGRSVVLDTSDYGRIMQSTKFLSMQDRKELEKEQKDRQETLMEASNARKKEMQELEYMRRKNEKPSDIEQDKMEDDSEVMAKAKSLLEEQDDEIKKINEYVLNAKCHAIRDVQLREKDEISMSMLEEKNRLDLMMEIERTKAVDNFNLKEKESQLERYKGAEVIQQQIKNREQQRLLDLEKKDQETQAMLQYLGKLQSEDMETVENKRLAQKELMKEVVKSNNEIEELKIRDKEQRKLDDMRVLEYAREKMRQEEAKIAEMDKERAQKEREIARMRAQQERAKDKQAERDALRAKRQQEEFERIARRKEKETAEKKFATGQMLIKARHQQVRHKEHFLAVQASQDRSEFERVLGVQKKEMNEEKQKDQHLASLRHTHGKEIRKQVRNKEEDKIMARKDFFEEGRRLDQEIKERKRKLNTIKQRKLIELREAGVPDKYCAEVSRRITAPPPSFTMSGHH